MERLFRRARPLSGALVLTCMTACAGTRAHPPSAAPPNPSAATPGESANAHPQVTTPRGGEGRAVVSNAGAYRVVYRSSPAPIPRGEVFALEAWVFDAHDAIHPLSEVELSVDASMPEHQHGMNRRPVVQALPGGEFRVEGLLFHMSGHWQLYFDITRGAITERAQASVELL